MPEFLIGVLIGSAIMWLLFGVFLIRDRTITEETMAKPCIRCRHHAVDKVNGFEHHVCKIYTDEVTGKPVYCGAARVNFCAHAKHWEWGNSDQRR